MSSLGRDCKLQTKNIAFLNTLFWRYRILDSKAEANELSAQWKSAQAKIVSEPEDKPRKLREFKATDLDGNLTRVFYDFRRDM
jgi:hypothetical protein